MLIITTITLILLLCNCVDFVKVNDCILIHIKYYLHLQYSLFLLLVICTRKHNYMFNITIPNNAIYVISDVIMLLITNINYYLSFTSCFLFSY